MSFCKHGELNDDCYYENMKDAVEHIYNILDDFDETNESCDYFSEIKRHMFFITKFIKRMEGIE